MANNRLTTFPVELLLNIIQYLPLSSLLNLHLSSRFWHEVISVNETTIFHQAALLHRYVCSLDIPLEDAVVTSEVFPTKTVASWKDFCRACLTLHRNWAGLESATGKTYCEDKPDVHRIKVDEARGLLITSHRGGGLRVTDLHTGERLWSLPKNYVREHAHLEYENGFLAFDRFGNKKEVWRISSDIDTSDVTIYASASPPDERQRSASCSTSQTADGNIRGRFVPWALLNMSQPTRAFRLVYPTLAIVGINCAFLWDVRTGELTQTIRELGNGNAHLGVISYVDVCERYLVVCSWQAVCIFSRSDGSLLLRIPSTLEAFARTRVVVQTRPYQFDPSRATVPMEPRVIPSSDATDTTHWPACIATHISRSGKDIAVMLSDNRLLLLQDFERVARKKINLYDAALEVVVRPRLSDRLHNNDEIVSVYLAFEHGRVAMVTNLGVFVFILDVTAHNLLDLETPNLKTHQRLGIPRNDAPLPSSGSFPYFAACFLPSLSIKRKRVLPEVSCLQITATRLYITWDSRIVPTYPEKAGQTYEEHYSNRARAGDVTVRNIPGSWQLAATADDDNLDDDFFTTYPPLVLCVDFRQTN